MMKNIYDLQIVAGMFPSFVNGFEVMPGFHHARK